jgi:predicted extracellular nuclease
VIQFRKPLERGVEGWFACGKLLVQVVGDLVSQIAGLPQHSFLYWGQTGTLDYAFASPAMARYVQAAKIWHINADRARNMDHPQPWLRASDHDPVIIDFSFSHSATSN